MVGRSNEDIKKAQPEQSIGILTRLTVKVFIDKIRTAIIAYSRVVMVATHPQPNANYKYITNILENSNHLKIKWASKVIFGDFNKKSKGLYRIYSQYISFEIALFYFFNINIFLCMYLLLYSFIYWWFRCNDWKFKKKL